MKGIVMDRIIRVTGKGRISVKPDTIQLNINTEGTCKEYGEAVSESAQQTGIIRNTIEKAGLDPKGLKTVHFGVDTEYESYQDKQGSWKQKFVGYKYRHSTYIRFDNDNAVLGKVRIVKMSGTDRVFHPSYSKRYGDGEECAARKSSDGFKREGCCTDAGCRRSAW